MAYRIRSQHSIMVLACPRHPCFHTQSHRDRKRIRGLDLAPGLEFSTLIYEHVGDRRMRAVACRGLGLE